MSARASSTMRKLPQSGESTDGVVESRKTQVGNAGRVVRALMFDEGEWRG